MWNCWWFKSLEHFQHINHQVSFWIQSCFKTAAIYFSLGLLKPNFSSFGWSNNTKTFFKLPFTCPAVIVQEVGHTLGRLQTSLQIIYIHIDPAGSEVTGRLFCSMMLHWFWFVNFVFLSSFHKWKTFRFHILSLNVTSNFTLWIT